jgi:TonB family protein
MRFHAALLSSLALHVAVLAIPAGNLSRSPFDTPETTDSPGRGSPAPLTVKLGQRQMAPAVAVTVSNVSIRREMPTASMLDATAAETPARVERDQAPESGEPRATTLGVPAPRYFSARELSERPEVIGDVADLPGEFAVIQDSGRLVLLLRINEAGTVDDVDVVTSGVSRQLQAIVVRQFGSARFVPAKKDGVAVKSRLKIEVIVKPPPSGATPSGTSATGN